MPLINLTKEEIAVIVVYLKKYFQYKYDPSETIPQEINTILEKLEGLDEVCECNNTSNVSTTGVELEDVDDSWYDEDGNIKC